jgi:cytochrome P450
LDVSLRWPDARQTHGWIARGCLEDADVAGIKINKCTIVIVPIYAIHRNPGYWDQPNAFDPNRFSNLDVVAKQNRFHYLPFGGGARLCLRQAFLVAEAVTLVARIIQSL